MGRWSHCVGGCLSHSADLESIGVNPADSYIDSPPANAPQGAMATEQQQMQFVQQMLQMLANTSQQVGLCSLCTLLLSLLYLIFCTLSWYSICIVLYNQNIIFILYLNSILCFIESFCFVFYLFLQFITQ